MKKPLVLSGLLAATLLLSGCSGTESTPVQTKTSPPPQITSPAPIQSSTPTPMPITTPTVTFDPTDRSYVERYDGAVIHTSVGDISLRFYGADAPMAVNNFLKLADAHFYDGTRFHRVIKGFMIQGGDPNSKDSDWSNDGIGGPGYKFNHEPNAHPIVRGSIAMANAGPNTNGSQFFILTAPNYAGPYTNFGEVTTGMQAVDTIEAARTNAADHPLEDLTITSIDLIEKK